MNCPLVHFHASLSLFLSRTLQISHQEKLVVTYFIIFVTPGHRGNRLKIITRLEKRTDIWHLVLLGENVLFKESPPSIMVTSNPNWSTKILWYGTGYAKGKILSPLKRPTWGKLHCWFCLKLLKVCSCFIFIGHPIIFPTLVSMNIYLRIFPTLALVNIV
jgi:hypothetical protein